MIGLDETHYETIPAMVPRLTFCLGHARLNK